MTDAIAELAQRLGYTFRDLSHLHRALNHVSVAMGQEGSHFERYEFLGDRVLGLCLAHQLMMRYPQESEGDLAKRFGQLSSRTHAAAIGVRLGLDGVLRASEPNWPQTPSADRLRADACEAILAAVYLDGGFTAAFACVERLWADDLARQEAPPQDAKSHLQEWAQARGYPTPHYSLVSRAGADHAPTFRTSVRVQDWYAEGEGQSMKHAEQKAAAALLTVVLTLGKKDGHGH